MYVYIYIYNIFYFLSIFTQTSAHLESQACVVPDM